MVASPEAIDFANNFSFTADFDSLKPLFFDCPSVNHNYTSRLKSERLIGYELSADLCRRGNVLILWDTSIKYTSRFTVEPYGGSLSYLSFNNNVCNSTVVGVTVLPETISTYSHLLRFVSARAARLASLRARSRDFPCYTTVVDPPGILYDYLYDFSRWEKFVAGRPKTQIFFQGRTYTYNKLPPFPQNKSKKYIKHKRGKKVGEAVTSSIGGVVSSELSVLSENILSVSNLNPLAISFNYHFINSKDCGTTLAEVRREGVGNIIIAHLNINSLRNKFDSLAQLVSGNIDILIIGETKLDDSFPSNNFIINGFKKPYRRDRNSDGGGLWFM